MTKKFVLTWTRFLHDVITDGSVHRIHYFPPPQSFHLRSFPIGRTPWEVEKNNEVRPGRKKYMYLIEHTQASQYGSNQANCSHAH